MFLIIFILLFERLLSEYYITNYTTSITITGLSCQVPHFNKTDCAPSGHTNPTSCEQSGCCYEAILYDTTIPWCFYGQDDSPTIMTINNSSFRVPRLERKECGYFGIEK